MNTKCCQTCKQFKDIETFSYNVNKKDYSSSCLQCLVDNKKKRKARGHAVAVKLQRELTKSIA